jgi:hypothetical protein
LSPGSPSWPVPSTKKRVSVPFGDAEMASMAARYRGPSCPKKPRIQYHVDVVQAWPSGVVK